MISSEQPPSDLVSHAIEVGTVRVQTKTDIRTIRVAKLPAGLPATVRFPRGGRLDFADGTAVLVWLDD